MTPLVTLAIPAFQRADLLQRTLSSAFAQTGLVSPDALEVLVVEDPAVGEATLSPVEGLCRSITDPRFRYERNPYNLGMVANWNRCLREARGRWVVILHDDDWLAPDFVRRCLDLLTANPALRLVGSAAYLVWDDRPQRRSSAAAPAGGAQRITPFHFLLGNPFFISGVMMDRQMALDAGGFDAAWYPTMDSDCWLRFCEAAPGAQLALPLVHYFIGRNVSLQPSILIGYIVNDFKQRRRILDSHYPGNPWLRWHSRLKPYRERPFLEQLFGVAIEAHALEQALRAEGWKPVARSLRWTYLPLRAVLALVARVSGERLRTARPG